MNSFMGVERGCLVNWRGLDMTPKRPLLRTDLMVSERSKLLRSIQSTQKMRGRCRHEQAVASAVAGMGRFICKSCGHISIKLVNEALTRAGIPIRSHQVDRDFL